MDEREMKKTTSVIRRRMSLVVTIMAFAAICLGVRLFDLQVLQRDELAARAQKQTETERKLQSPRGMILDRNGKVMAISEMSKSLYADPSMIKEKGEDPAEIAALLAPYLRIDQATIQQRLEEDTAFVWLDRQMDHDKSEAIEDTIKKNQLKGLAFRDESRRFYPNGTLASQILGFVGDNDAGLEGIEMVYNDEIRGNQQTFRLQTDTNNIPIFQSALEKVLPDKEKSVRLTIDSDIQYVTEKCLDGIIQRNQPEGASIIVMDPRSGEILAMASRPTYDPNHFSSGSPAQYHSRAVTDIYEPGSTFKPIVAAAALDSGKWSLSDTYQDEGTAHVADRTIENWDGKGMGTVTLREMLMYSLNTGMAHIAVQMGGKLLTTYAQKFGFGQVTGIELPGEQEGILFPPDKISIVDTAVMGFGQGIAVTPLQMVQAFGALANEGHMMKPYLVKEIDNPDGSIYKKTEAKEVSQPVSAGTAETIGKIMGEEISSGGGVNAKVEGYTFAGKTGTAQKKNADVTGYAEGQYVASFVGFGPLEHPQYVVLIVVDDPQGVYYGAQVAAPVFKELMTEIVRMKSIPADGEHIAAAENAKYVPVTRSMPEVHTGPEGVLMPSFVGWSTREVNTWLKEAGLGFVPKGSGQAVSQLPLAGSYAPPGSDVTVYFARPSDGKDT